MQRGRLTEVLDLISKDNKLVNMRDDLGGRTPLHAAAINGQSIITYILLEHGAAVDAKDKYDHTALMYALKYGHPKTAIMLIYSGNANVNLSNGSEMPLDVVLHNINHLQDKDTSAAKNDAMADWHYLEKLIRERCPSPSPLTLPAASAESSSTDYLAPISPASPNMADVTMGTDASLTNNNR